MNEFREKDKRNGKDQVTLRMDGGHFAALDTLAPGLGSNRGEVIRFIIIDWMKQSMGMEWMREKRLIK